MNNNIGLVIAREYSLRVKKRSFIITTLIFPILIILLMFLPTLLQGVGSQMPETITVSDPTGKIGPLLVTDGQLNYAFTTDPIDSVITKSDRLPAIGLKESIIETPERSVAYYSTESPGMEMLMVMTEDLEQAVEKIRLEAYDITNLNEILDEVDANVYIDATVLKDNGETERADAVTGFVIGMAMSFILYMFLLIYGQLVMHSVIEEKNNRVLELIVSSVKPTQLMIGKIVGIGAVALTQVAIWAIVICAFVKFGLPSIVGHNIMDNMGAIMAGEMDPASVGADIKLLQVLSIVSSLGYVFSVFGYLMVFLVGGFMLYASIYAAIGAAVDNAQDGAQLQIFATVPIVLALMFSISVGQDPNSPLAFWLSIIPFTSPMVMMMRIPSGVPAGEIILSIALLAATVIFFLWFSAKIYRVGIFMYGKKPTVKDLIRWARYK